MRTIYIVPICLALLVAGCAQAEPQDTTAQPIQEPIILPSATVLRPTTTPFPTTTPMPAPERHTTVLMGTDWDSSHPERTQFGERSDVIVLVTWVETWEKQLQDFALISIPRDLWVKVSCSPLDPVLQGYDRTNSAYAYGGFDCVRKMVEENFGLVVDQPMFLVQMRSFIEIVKLFEPLKVMPTETYRDWCGDFLGTEGRGGYKLWTAGIEYTMDPNEVMCYARGRRGAASGDLDRNRRALEILEAMALQYPPQVSGNLTNWGPGEYVELWGIFSEYIQSDIQITDIPGLIHLVPQVFSQEGIADWRMIRFTLEETDYYRTPLYNASVLLPTVKLKPWLACMLEGEEREQCTPANTLALAAP